MFSKNSCVLWLFLHKKRYMILGNALTIGEGTPMNSDESQACREQAARDTMISEIREASCGDVCEFDFQPVILTFS
jgi:hypothetical protein